MRTKIFPMPVKTPSVLRQPLLFTRNIPHPDRSNFNSVRHSKIDHKRCTLCCSHLFTNIDCTVCCGSPIGPIRYNSEFRPPNSIPISGNSCDTATGSNPSFSTDSDVNLRIASLEECLRAHEDRIKAQEDFASEMRNILRLRRELEESICKVCGLSC